MTDYDAIQALNWSTLKQLATSPKMLKTRETIPREDTPALALGRAIHCQLLEPAMWANYCKLPHFGDMRSSKNRDARDAWLADGPPGRVVLDADDYDLAVRCADAIREHPEAMKLIVGGRREETVLWTDESTGLKCKARLDNIRPNDLSDIKSTRKESPGGFLRDASKFLYHGQLAWYHAGAIAAGVLPPDAERPSVVAVQTVEPFDVMPFRMTQAALDAGTRLWKSLIKRYTECQTAEWWPGVAPQVLDYDVMPWAAGADPYEEQEDEEAF